MKHFYEDLSGTIAESKFYSATRWHNHQYISKKVYDAQKKHREEEIRIPINGKAVSNAAKELNKWSEQLSYIEGAMEYIPINKASTSFSKAKEN